MWQATRNDRGRALLEIAEEQAGYFTAKQALKSGYSYRLQHYHKSKGHWIEVDRAIFRLANYPNSPYEDLVRCSLWGHNREAIPQAVISHESALVVHELSDVMPSKICLTIPPSFRKKAQPGCVIYRAIVRPEDVEKRGGFIVTKPLKTIIDVAEGNLGLEQLEKAVRDAFNKGLLNFNDITQARMSHAAREKLRIVIDSIKKNPLF